MSHIHKTLSRVMVIGSTGSGKTSLLAALDLIHSTVKKTEAVQYNDESIDTPGEYMDNRFFGFILETARKAKLVLFVVDPTRISHFPPRFRQVIGIPAIGVITKIDAGTLPQREMAKKILMMAGVKEVIECSSKTKEGITTLRKQIDDLLSQ